MKSSAETVPSPTTTARRAGECLGAGAEPAGRGPAAWNAAAKVSSENPWSFKARAISASLESLR